MNPFHSNLRPVDCCQTMFPEEVMGNYAESFGLLSRTVPFADKELPCDIVLFLTEADHLEEALPHLSIRFDDAFEVVSVLPDIFEEKLTDIFCDIFDEESFRRAVGSASERWINMGVAINRVRFKFLSR